MVRAELLAQDEQETFRPSRSGWCARGFVWGLLAWLVLAVPANKLSPFDLGVADVGAATEAVIFGIVGLSLNVLSATPARSPSATRRSSGSAHSPRRTSSSSSS